MNDPQQHSLGGDVDLRPARPRGLPFLKPLYGLPPYQYTNDTTLIVVYETDREALLEVLPRELEPLPGNVVAMCFFHCPDVTGIGPHDFTMPCLPVRFGEEIGQFVPYLYTSTDASLACYREMQGWPAVFGETEIVADGGRVRARLRRQGRELVRAEAEVGGAKITELEFLPIMLYKEIPNLDGTARDAAYLLRSTSLFTNLDFRAGTGSVGFPDAGDDPIARLVPRKITTALYGTLDDLYPETIRILERYA